MTEKELKIKKTKQNKKTQNNKTKTKETNFVGRLKGKFYIGGEKMRNVSGLQGENEWQRK